MALINRKAQEEAAAQTATEASEVVDEKASAEMIEEKKAGAPPVSEIKEVAVKQQASAPAAASKGFWFTNPDVQEVVETAGYGDFPQIIASQGTFQEAGANGADLGKWLAFKPIQAKVKLVCSPNSNDEEAKEYFAAAYEGETTMGGKTIEECVEDAKAAGYEKADIKEYIDLFAYVVSHESGDALNDEVVVLQLAPMSKIEWRKFSKKLEMKAAFKKLEIQEDFVVKAVAKSTKNKANQSYTHYTFELA